MRNVILCGDVREQLRLIPDETVNCVVTSPPYWGLRDYGQAGQLGLEATPEAYVQSMVEVFREVRRVMRRDATCWLNLGDIYASDTKGSGGPSEKQLTNVGSRYETSQRFAHGLKPKDLVGIPWRVAFALQADGWWLRSDIIWSKPNPMPESVTDRPTKAHEYLFLLSKSQTYYYDADAIREKAEYGFSETVGLTPHEKYDASAGTALQSPTRAPNRVIPGTGGTRNRRTVWEIATKPYTDAHFATYPEELVKPCILAGTSEHGNCSVCGAPWERVTERTPMLIDRSERTHDLGRTRSSGTMVEPPKSVTTGWAPTCKHEAPVVRAIVLDPFLGSGTTAAVAKVAGRDYIGIELNPSYVELAKQRINVDQERLL